MKFKELKIEVPEWSSHMYPREVVHVSIQNHSFKLGYKSPSHFYETMNTTKSEVINAHCKFIHFGNNGLVLCTNEAVFFDKYWIESELISWQDFLKLTKDDVIIDETGKEATRIEINQMMEPKIDMSSFTHRFIMSHPEPLLNGQWRKKHHHRRIKLPMEV